jgi:uncharacterized membrane protein
MIRCLSRRCLFRQLFLIKLLGPCRKTFIRKRVRLNRCYAGFHQSRFCPKLTESTSNICRRRSMQNYVRYAVKLTALPLMILVFNPFNAALAGSWRICNKTPDKVTVAVAYSNSFGQILTKGWWTLGACGGCSTVIGTDLANQLPDKSNAYLYAHSGGTGIIEGEENFCVDSKAFSINSSASPGCQERRPFKAQSINLNRTWTTNITGRGVSGRGCID